MGKKVKCKDCKESMRWAIPSKVGKENLEYAEHCLAAVQRSMVCGRTSKTKLINHEQQCKYFRKKADEFIDLDERYEKKRIAQLEGMIADAK